MVWPGKKLKITARSLHPKTPYKAARNFAGFGLSGAAAFFGVWTAGGEGAAGSG
jgi:hypothetical protein